jgi:DNA-binding CsgD family transcriptional regulator
LFFCTTPTIGVAFLMFMPLSTATILEKQKAFYAQLLTDTLPTVSAEEQAVELASLQNVLQYDRHRQHFFCVINLKDFTLEHIHSIDKCLGYADFDMFQYIDSLHKESLPVIMKIAEASIQLLNKDAVQFLSPKLVAYVAIRHAKGHYLYVKRILSPWQINANGQVTAYLNESTIIKEYDGAAYQVTIQGVTNPTEKEGLLRKEVSEKIEAEASPTQRFEEKALPFTVTDIRLARLLHYHQPRLDNKDIAKKLNVTESTLVTYRRDLMQRASNYFKEKSFHDSADVAKYLYEMYII